MAKKKAKILIADDEEYILKWLNSLLSQEGYDVEFAKSGEDALLKLITDEFAVVLADLTLPDLSGLKLLSILKEKGILTETIIFTGKGSIATAVDAIKNGAYDYVSKPVDPDRLKTIILKAVEHYKLVISNNNLKEQIDSLIHYEDLVGQSRQMLEIYKLIDVIADSTASVVITGASGTGKELVARAIHNRSDRAKGPFVAVNCSAFPKEILENELFGHEQGAFTGAIKEKAGCFELAHTGTLFLDEICEMPLEIQPKFLRALEERRFRRLGGKREIEVDLRLISASNKRLEEGVEDKSLREDIFYRLSVVEIDLPPLRERVGDVPLLMKVFLKLFSERNNKPNVEFRGEASDAMNRYYWPGNVRELRNTIERAVVLCDSDSIQLKDLPERIKNPTSAKMRIPIALGSSIEDAERQLIFETLDFVNNNKTRAAQILGISLKTLHNKLNLYRSENLN